MIAQPLSTADMADYLALAGVSSRENTPVGTGIGYTQVFDFEILHLTSLIELGRPLNRQNFTYDNLPNKVDTAAWGRGPMSVSWNVILTKNLC